MLNFIIMWSIIDFDEDYENLVYDLIGSHAETKMLDMAKYKEISTNPKVNEHLDITMENYYQIIDEIEHTNNWKENTIKNLDKKICETIADLVTYIKFDFQLFTTKESLKQNDSEVKIDTTFYNYITDNNETLQEIVDYLFNLYDEFSEIK